MTQLTLDTLRIEDINREGSITRPARLAGVVYLLAGAKLLIHLLTTGRFGYEWFVDELYYMATAEHLAWGYVDMPPLFPAITALVRATLGDSLFAIRLVPTLAGAALILLTGLIARELGGGRLAQGLSCLAVLLAPIYLVGHSFHTMNAIEPLLWTSGALTLHRIVVRGEARLWLAFGVIAGIGLLNKHSMVFFGVAVVVSLLATPARKAFSSRWVWLGGLVALGIVLPNLIWEIGHGFPHLEQLANIRANGRDVGLSSIEFVAQQFLILNPFAAPLWIGGLVRLLTGKPTRHLGVLYLALLGLMLVMNGRVYYLAPIYPLLFAAGGVAAESAAVSRPWFRRVVIAGVLVVVTTGSLLAPTMLPVLPPDMYIRYVELTHLDQPRIENHELGPLPQLFADRFGWKEMVDVVARAYHSLPPEERAKAAIFGQNYGQAGAIDLYGPELGLPRAISGHLTYWYWGPRDTTGEIVIVMGSDRETLEPLFESVEPAGWVAHPYSMPYEHFDLWLCRGLKIPMSELWPMVKSFD
jgi:hypothetical protein